MYRLIPQLQINKVKQLLKKPMALREIARATGLTYYTVRKIGCDVKGVPYRRTDLRLDGYFDHDGTCPITGFRITEKQNHQALNRRA